MRHRAGNSGEGGIQAQKTGNAAGPLRRLRIAPGRIAPPALRVGLALVLTWIIIHALADPCLGSYMFPEGLRRLQGEFGQPYGADELAYEGVAVPLERPVDPDTYRLIPGDRLHIGIWGDPARTHRIRVSPEGDLLIPDVGPVRVAGRTLRVAESVVTAELRPYYSTEAVTVRIVELGLYRIAVTGMVASPGMVELTSMDRLTDALEAAGGLLSGASLRRISLRDPGASAAPDTRSTQGGQTPISDPVEIDLLQWFLDGDPASNPVLAPGLGVDVPVRGAHVRVRGPVNRRIIEKDARPRIDQIPNRPPEEPESIIEWRQGDTVGRILAWQGGLSEAATGRATLLRRGSQRVDLDLTLGESLQTMLQPGDLLEIEYGNRWVYIVGSVRFPGRFPYLPGRTALDYVAMAGGATELGRATGWRLIHPDGKQTRLALDITMEPGYTIRVPERRTYTLASLLSPLSTATAVVISVIALTR